MSLTCVAGFYSDDVPPAHEGFPMRAWSIRVFILGPNGEELPATVFDKVIYKLHPTFPNPTRGMFVTPGVDEPGLGYAVGISLGALGL
jgi:transcription initiation factor TFIID/TFIIF subunit